MFGDPILQLHILAIFGESWVEIQGDEQIDQEFMFLKEIRLECDCHITVLDPGCDSFSRLSTWILPIAHYSFT